MDVLWELAGWEDNLSLLIPLLKRHKEQVTEKHYKTGQTLLQYACSYGNCDLVLHLVNMEGVSLEMQDDLYGYTALHFACFYDKLFIIQEILELNEEIQEKAEKAFNIADKLGWNCLHHAAKNGNVTIAKILLEHNCELNAKDKKGKIPIHIAAENGHKDILQYLFNNSPLDCFMVPVADESGFTALHYAAKGGHQQCIEWLKSKQFSPHNLGMCIVDHNEKMVRTNLSAEDVANLFGHYNIARSLKSYTELLINPQQSTESRLNDQSTLKSELAKAQKLVEELKKENEVMKIKINQLEEQVNESNADFIIQRLKKENDQLYQLVNKYHESNNANRKSDDLKNKMGPQAILDSSMVFIEDVTITDKELGRGSYGSVCAAVYHGKPCVAKILYPFLKIRGKSSRDIAIEEWNILNKLKHPSIVQFYGVCEGEFEVPILIMEKLWKSLDVLLEEKQNQLSLLTKTHILHDVACGLQYMHNQKTPVIHRDINTTNVMLTEHLQAKIIDVGQAKILGVVEKQRLSPAPGKHAYMAPETLNKEPTYDTKADIFSLGCTIIYLVIERFPEPTGQFVRDKNKSDVFVKNSELDRRKQFIDLMVCSDFLSDMVHQCLKESPIDRPTASYICAQLEKYIQQLQSESPALAERYKQDKLSLLYMLQAQEKEYITKQQGLEKMRLKYNILRKENETKVEKLKVAELQQANELSELRKKYEEKLPGLRTQKVSLGKFQESSHSEEVLSEENTIVKKQLESNDNIQRKFKKDLKASAISEQELHDKESETVTSQSTKLVVKPTSKKIHSVHRFLHNSGDKCDSCETPTMCHNSYDEEFINEFKKFLTKDPNDSLPPTDSEKAMGDTFLKYIEVHIKANNCPSPCRLWKYCVDNKLFYLLEYAPEGLLVYSKNKQNEVGTVIGAYSEYKNFKLIGSGGFGNIYQYNDQIAVKEEFKHPLITANSILFQRVMELDHPHVIKVLDYIVGPYDKPYGNNRCFLLVMSFKNQMDLQKQFKKKLTCVLDYMTKYPDQEKFIFRNYTVLFQHVFKGLCYLKSKEIVHRDIKSSNILVHQECKCESPLQCRCTDDGKVTYLLGDWDLLSLERESTYLTYTCDEWNKMASHDPSGTTGMKPPESFFRNEKGDNITTHKSDVWSACVTMMNVLIGKAVNTEAREQFSKFITAATGNTKNAATSTAKSLNLLKSIMSMEQVNTGSVNNETSQLSTKLNDLKQLLTNAEKSLLRSQSFQGGLFEIYKEENPLAGILTTAYMAQVLHWKCFEKLKHIYGTQLWRVVEPTLDAIVAGIKFVPDRRQDATEILEHLEKVPVVCCANNEN